MIDNDFPLISDWPKCDYAVVGMVLFDARNRVACQLRDDFEHVAGGGMWSIFGGHHEPPESLVETAVREVNEELGLMTKPEDFEPLLRMVPADGLQAYHYYYRYKKPVLPHDFRLDEGAGFAFLHAEQARNMPFMASARHVLTYLEKHKMIAMR